SNPNPLTLFQIWLTLPSHDKLAEPHFAMLWNESVPRRAFEDARGRRTEVMVVAGRLDDAAPLAPPPKSWAADPANDVAIWTIKMARDAQWTLPAAAPESNRVLYFFVGSAMHVDGEPVPVNTLVQLRADREVT